MKKKALHLTEKQIRERFPSSSKCKVSYRNQKKPVNAILDNVDLSKVNALTIQFEQPKCYLINGDACVRPGVRVVVVR